MLADPANTHSPMILLWEATPGSLARRRSGYQAGTDPRLAGARPRAGCVSERPGER